MLKSYELYLLHEGSRSNSGKSLCYIIQTSDMTPTPVEDLGINELVKTILEGVKEVIN